MPVAVLLLFGLAFAAAGGAIVGVSAGWIPAKESSFHAPRWVVGCVGAVFFGAGCSIMLSALRAPWRRWVLAGNRKNHPGQPARWDYPWEVRGPAQKRFGKVALAFFWAAAITCFLFPFNWWAFVSDDGPLMVQIIVGVFDLVAVACWWGAFHTLVWALKYGPARLTWDGFPIRPESVLLHWEPGRGLIDWTRGAFTLRCIRERIETVKRANKTSVRQVHECLWEETRELEAGRGMMGRGTVDVAFAIPSDAPGTTIQAPEPVYWELEVTIPRPGVDFTHRYLVPIYR